MLRLLYLILAAFFFWLAFATRNHPQWFPEIVAIYGGDIFWTTMVVFALRSVLLKPSVWKLVTFTSILGAVTEASQLYHTPWLDDFRNTKFGGILLGHGFLWSDIVCYVIGAVFAGLIITIIEKRKARR